MKYSSQESVSVVDNGYDPAAVAEHNECPFPQYYSHDNFVLYAVSTMCNMLRPK